MNRWSRITLVLDACFLLFMGLGATASAWMSSANGSRIMGSLFRGQPLVLGFVDLIGISRSRLVSREPAPVPASSG